MIETLQELMRKVAKDEVMPRFLKVGFSKKADGTLFTSADIAAQNMLLAELGKIVAAPVLGEEMNPAEQRRLWDEHSGTGLWVVDPIDGTTNFVNGVPHFSISVAFVKNGRAEMGAVYNPIMDEMFAAMRGGGAELNGQPLPIRRSENMMSEAIAAVEVKYLRSGKLASRIQNLSPCGSRRSFGSSTLDWCYLAAGRFDLYLHGGQKLWDYAAGSLIFEESGGYWNTLEGDDFWSGEHVFNRSVIAATNEDLFKSWLRWVRNNQ